LSHANQLFSRDLKRLVDPKFSVRPVHGHRKIPTLLAGTGAVVALIGIGSLLLSLLGGSTESETPGSQVAAKSVESASDQIAAQIPQSAKPKAQLADTGSRNDQSTDNEQPGNVADEKTANNEFVLPAELRDTIQWSNYKIKPGDSLSRIFKKQKLSAADALRIAAHEGAGDIKTLVPGKSVRIGRDENSALRALSFELRNNRSLNIILGTDGSLKFDSIQAELEKQSKSIDIVINSSLFKAASDAGLSDKLILKLAGVYAWDIDFAKDLQKGDRFSIIHEELVDGKARRGEGEILAARYVSPDRELYAFRQAAQGEAVEYFDQEGRNLRSTFLRTPMKISKITSGYSKSRLHPISKERKAHTGVDYAAPKGTPILATANGSVGFMGNKNGYGKTVILKHANNYRTLYAHLSSWKSKIKPGTRVKQGQIIGFVGRTGSATAPHLHYEFQVNGTHVDPLGYELPRAESIAAGQRDVFLKHAQELKALLTNDGTIQLARNESD
jgi:murein DD-endopeptidase MepM/ murein hydrolase activator NlpD